MTVGTEIPRWLHWLWILVGMEGRPFLVRTLGPCLSLFPPFPPPFSLSLSTLPRPAPSPHGPSTWSVHQGHWAPYTVLRVPPKCKSSSCPPVRVWVLSSHPWWLKPVTSVTIHMTWPRNFPPHLLSSGWDLLGLPTLAYLWFQINFVINLPGSRYKGKTLCLLFYIYKLSQGELTFFDVMPFYPKAWYVISSVEIDCCIFLKTWTVFFK